MINTLFQTLYTLFNLCLLRTSPAQLPYSALFLGLLVLAELGLNIFTLNKLKGVSLNEVITASLVSLIVLVMLIFALLAQRKVQNRIYKVLTAWFGTELMLTLILKILLIIIPDKLQNTTTVQAILQIGFFTWNVVIKAYIFKFACDIKMSRAVLITFAILIISTLPIQFLLSEYITQSLPQTE